MDHRSHYRLDAGDADHLQVAVLRDGAPPAEALPLDVGPDGARLQFETPGGPNYTMGQVVHLSFSSSRLGKPLVIEARAIRRMEDRGHRTYAFRFTNHHQFEGHASEVIYRLLNRRSSYRVSPPDDQPIELTLKPEAGGAPLVHGRLIDISATGLGARISVDVEAKLVATLRVNVSVALPGHGDTLGVPGIIRSRVLAGSHVRYGIAFDFDAADHAESKQNAIIDYVMRRQREELRHVGR